MPVCIHTLFGEILTNMIRLSSELKRKQRQQSRTKSYYLRYHRLTCNPSHHSRRKRKSIWKTRECSQWWRTQNGEEEFATFSYYSWIRTHCIPHYYNDDRYKHKTIQSHGIHSISIHVSSLHVRTTSDPNRAAWTAWFAPFPPKPCWKSLQFGAH